MKYYRLEDNNGFGVFNENNSLYNMMNDFTEDEIHFKGGFYSMLDPQIKKSLSKAELLAHHCCFAKQEELALLNQTGYNILELELTKVLPSNGSQVLLFKKSDIISVKNLGKN